MNDYLDIFEKFKDVTEVADLYNEVLLLRAYHNARLYQKMLEYIDHLASKYWIEKVAWNLCNTQQPLTYEQSYINAENFLCAKGVKLIVEKVIGYKNRLTSDEVNFVESIIKLVG